MQDSLWPFVGLFFLLGQVYCLDATNKNAIYSPAQVNGTEGKVTSVTIYIPTHKIPAGICSCQWLHNNKIIDANSRFNYSEDRSTGQFFMKIIYTQRNDTGSYKVVCDNKIESREKFLYVIEVPEDPIIELKVENGQRVMYCITKKLSPIPEITLNGEGGILHANATHYWINKTVTSGTTNEVCVLQFEDYYKCFETINIADESKRKTTPLVIPVKDEDSPTNEWKALKITGGIFGGILTIVCLYIFIKNLRKSSQNNKTAETVFYTAVPEQV